MCIVYIIVVRYSKQFSLIYPVFIYLSLFHRENKLAVT